MGMRANTLIARGRELTREVSANRKSMHRLARERRAVMLRLNREHGITYHELAVLFGIGKNRMPREMRQARIEAERQEGEQE